MRGPIRWLFSLFVAGWMGCGTRATTLETAPVTTTATPIGEWTRTELEHALPAWLEIARTTDVSDADARALASVPEGAEVEVYLGGWCGDSRREVTRFWRALDLAGDVPFRVRWIAVGRDKRVPGLTDNIELRYVPTFVVSRDGREVGRIIESAPRGIEIELNALLRGERAGVISGRTDL